MSIANGAISRKLIVLLCLKAIVLVGVVYVANRFLYFGPGLPKRDYIADYTQHGLTASGRSIEQAEAASAKALEIERILRDEITPTMNEADAYFGMLGTEAEQEDTWPQTEPIVLASLQKAEQLGLRRATDELIGIGVFIDPNLIRVDGRDQMAPPRIATLRRLGHMEADFLILAARSGDARGVVEAYERIAGLADVAASSGGGILVHLIGIALRTRAIEALMDVLCEREHDQEFLEAVRVVLALDRNSHWPEVPVVLEGDLIGSRHMSSELGNPPLKTVNPAYQLGLMAEDYEAAVNLWSTHPEGPVAGLRAFREWAANSRRPGLLAGILLPSTERYLATVTQLELLRVAEQAVLAIERHRATAGELPASLEALVPEYLPAAPTDPFSRHTLVYAIDPALPNGYRLYACGADGQDDGGAYKPSNAAEATSLDARGIDYPIVPRPE